MNIIPSGDIPVWEKEKLGGWNEEIFESLSSKNKKAYALAARLHHNVFRKNGDPYLVHINRSLVFLKDHKDLLPEALNIELLTLYIILHDCIEDNKDGLQMIQKYFGNEMMISVLWMSAPKVAVLDQLDRFLWKTETETETETEKDNSQYEQFSSISQVIHANTPEDIWTIEELSKLLPDWDWISLWKNWFKKRYESAEDPEKQKNVFADWVFQGMVYNMPEGEFLAKSFERLDNLTDIEGLQDEKWMVSYRKTMFTTEKTYIPRLQALHMNLLKKVMEDTLHINNPDIKRITDQTKKWANQSTEGG